MNTSTNTPTNEGQSPENSLAINLRNQMVKIFEKDHNMLAKTKNRASKKLDELVTVFNEKDALIHSLKEEILSIKKEQMQDETTTNQKLEIATLKGQLEESRSMFSEIIKENTTLFKRALENSSNQLKEKTTPYSEVVKQKEKITSEKTTVIVAALDQKATAKEVQEKLAKNLGNTCEAGKIKKIITGKQQQVIIKMTGIEEANQLREKIKENEKLKNELKVTQPKPKTHEVIVYGIPDGTQQEDVTKSITIALNKTPEHTNSSKNI
ncbi:hypothetical protein CDAR_189891 [Caerostris darwini]|uniref:Uncharacterized protein n=1 Tax=Caerostris darwini TaxID=1538125 RepID=A0AAV4QME1_9ARAC|nr:hypothetical protein CDAR_189891 [Caerostris darwini]